MQRVKIVNETNGIYGTHCYINEQELHDVTAVSFKQEAGSVPTFEFTTTGLPNIEMAGEVEFRFAPDTVKLAAVVLQNEFRNNSESRKALVASIASVLKEMPAETEMYNVAEMISNRIIGAENEKVV